MARARLDRGEARKESPRPHFDVKRRTAVGCTKRLNKTELLAVENSELFGVVHVLINHRFSVDNPSSLWDDGGYTISFGVDDSGFLRWYDTGPFTVRLCGVTGEWAVDGGESTGCTGINQRSIYGQEVPAPRAIA